MARVLLCMLGMIGVSMAQQADLPVKQVGWMRVVNTAEAEFKIANGHYADADELALFAQSHAQGAAKQFATMTRETLAPYSLSIMKTPDGTHYVAEIKRVSDMK